MKLLSIFQRIAADVRGATAVEYGLILALIFLAIMAGVSAFGVEVGNMYNHISAKAGGAMT
ncbi:MAG: Flp family type IVb pilin [Porphyrobacter sp.]|nr:Flp family type IVb pilin [Porphyrobacter sp.]